MVKKNEKEIKTEETHEDSFDADVTTENAKDAEEDVLRENSDSVSLEKQELLALYQKLKDLGINSIGDLEVKISRL